MDQKWSRLGRHLHDRTVSDEVEIDHRREVLDARMTHLSLEFASGFGLRDLLFTETFRFLSHG